LQSEIPIAIEDTSETLGPKLASIGAELMLGTLRGLNSGTIHSIPQDNSQATLAPILKKEDGRMDFARTAQELFNRLRGFQPWPGAFTTFRGKTLRVLRAQSALLPFLLTPGEMAIEGYRVLVGCSRSTDAGNALELSQVQVEGKRPMTAQEFINGYRPKSGDRLGH
jgi:methionyl-tRNA formyltransferase